MSAPVALIIEDEPLAAKAIVSVLEREGIDVRVAFSLAEARRIASQVSLIIYDLHVEGGPFDLLRKLRDDGHRQPAIVYSGWKWTEELLLAAGGLGVVKWIVKGGRGPDGLADAIRATFGRAVTPPPPPPKSRGSEWDEPADTTVQRAAAKIRDSVNATTRIAGELRASRPK